MYTTINNVRDLTNGQLTESQMGDESLSKIILQACAKINSIINVYVREEEVKYLDEVRKNKINDGETTTFYVKNGITNYLSDMDNDGEVTTDDVRVYKIDSDNNRTELTVSDISVEEGSFTLSSPPGKDTKHLYVWYAFSYYNVSTPDKLIELLTSYLAASYAYLQKDHGIANKVKFGNIDISRTQGSSSYNRFNDRFNELLRQITIPLNKPRTKDFKYQI